MSSAFVMPLISAVVLILVPVLSFYFVKKSRPHSKLIFKICLILFFALFIALDIGMCKYAFAESASTTNASAGLGYIAAALAVGISCIGCGWAVSSGSAAALGALSENDKIMGKALIMVAMGEGVGIYGLIIALMILGKL